MTVVTLRTVAHQVLSLNSLVKEVELEWTVLEARILIGYVFPFFSSPSSITLQARSLTFGFTGRMGFLRPRRINGTHHHVAEHGIYRTR